MLVCAGTPATLWLIAIVIARETDVLALIGASAARPYLSMSIVKTHVTNVLTRTGSRDRVRAAIVAIRAGLSP